MPERKISEFFENDLPAYASYDNVRKLAGIDGLKMSMRKIIFTMLAKYPGKEKIKTDTVANICAAYTNYLHGSANLEGVCNTLAQSFVGSNNYPLLEGNSSGFGTRINPVCAASRYTKIALSPIAEALLNKDDLEIVDKQYFEGTYIEPKYFIPIFPILFLNGSHGLSTGYAQDIYPRDPNEIIKYIECKLNNKKFKGDLLPWFKGFTGNVKYNTETEKIECYGKIEKVNTTTYIISELPIGIEYSKYIDILEKLCDTNIISDYTDNCDTKTDIISFEIKTTREFSKKYENNIAELYRIFKLVKPLSETLCCINENNRVIEYNSIEDILDAFIKIRLNYYNIRKQHILNKIENKLIILNSKYIFCDSIIKDELIISKAKKIDIIKKLDTIKGITKIDDSYDYLLTMPIHSISYETLTKLKSDIKDLKEKQKEIKNTDINTMWLSDLAILKKYF